MDQLDEANRGRLTALLRAMSVAKGVKDDNVPCQIEEGLYVGSIGAANNKSALRSLNITHILTVTSSMPPYPDEFKYKIVDVQDRHDVSISQYFDDCFDFIDEAKERGGKVLVHCFAGISRSVTVIVAYLIKKHGLRCSEALEHVKSKRAIASPNPGFLLQLQNFERSLRGWPYYNPDFEDIMSSSAYASIFKTLGGAFNTKGHGSAGGSGSGNNVEDAAESAGPQVTAPDPVDPVENVVGFAGASDCRVTKKRKQPGVKPPKVKTVVPDKVVCDEELQGSDKRSAQIGNFTLEKQADTMSEIPSDQDWADMEGIGLFVVLRRMTGHWGHLGSLISGAAQLSMNEVRAAQTEKKAAEDRANSLDKELRDLKSFITEKEIGFKTQLDAANVRADNAEKDAADLREETQSLKKKLENQDKDAIIAEFKKSKEYDEALATAGAPEIFRCWVIAEKHIKTDPLADWDSFVKEFLAAKRDIENGEGEPEPFDGPSPSFIPAAAPINPDQD